MEVEASAGQKIVMCTDNYLFNDGGEPNLRGEYITKAGTQQYESLGWLNGQKVYYIIPKGIKVIKLAYRETGYDTKFAGSFTSSDPFFNKLWQKSQRTLYITMRDGYMDCPDRERAQWTGDATNESGEAFYALSPSSHALA
jgi:alpha-L-rhamnosidase